MDFCSNKRVCCCCCVKDLRIYLCVKHGRLVAIAGGPRFLHLPGAVRARCVARDPRRAVDKLGLEDHIGVLPHALLQRHNDKLRKFKVRSQHLADVLRVGEVQRCVDFVQNVHGRRLEEQQRQNERERKQRLLPAAQLGQVLPDASERNTHFEAFQLSLTCCNTTHTHTHTQRKLFLSYLNSFLKCWMKEI